jgi:hypothetical protein
MEKIDLLKIRDRIIKLIPFTFLVLSISSCANSYYATSNKSRFIIEVDSYGNDSYLLNKRYLLATGDSTINENDLQYIEFSEYVKKALDHKGYSETKNPEEADVVVFFKYGISDPQTFQRTVSIPTWGQTGVKSTNTTGNVYVNPYGKNINYNQTTTSTPTYGVTGYRTVNQTITQYLRFLTITVYDSNEYKETGKDKIVWNTIITSSGSSGDLRKVFPYLIVAGQNFFGLSSGERKEVNIYEGDERINQLKGITND